MGYFDTKTDVISDQSFLPKLLDLSHEAIFTWELNGTIIYWNNGAEKKYGFTRSEAIGYDRHLLLNTKHHTDLDGFLSLLAETGSWEGEIQHTTKDGRTLIVEARLQVTMDDSKRLIVLETNRDITHRKSAEKEASESNSKLVTAIETMMDAFCIADYDGRITYINDAFASFFRYKNKDECFETVNECYDTFDLYSIDGKLVPCSQRFFIRAGKGEYGRYEEYIVCHKTSGQTWVGNFSFGPIRGESGMIIGYLVTCRDITEQKRQEEEIFKSHKRITEILESISDGFYSLDSNWRFSYINRRAANNVGFEPEELINQSIWDKFKSIKGTILEFNFRKAMSKREPVHFEFLGMLTNRYYNCNIYPTKDGISIYWLDITERKLSETKANEAKDLANKQSQKLNIILENMFEGVMIVDRNGDIIHINKSGLKLHGLQTSNYNEFKEFRNNYEVYTLEGELVGSKDLPIERAVRGESFKNYELILRRKDIDFEWIGCYSCIPICNENGDFNFSIITLRDVTEHIKHIELIYKSEAEKEKREILENAIKVKDEFLSLVSHELKTPITIIDSTLQVMEYVCKDELSYKMKNYLEIIRQNSMRQLRVVNNILELAKINGGINRIKKHRIDLVLLTKVILESVIMYAQQKKIEVSFRCSESQKVICIDDEKYERILLNLLSNAVKYSPEGKLITVSLKFYKKRASLIVKDEGIGVPSEKMSYIFEKFGRVDSSMARETEGIGIGLCIVKLLVEAMGGSIRVNSILGNGSTFIVKLPISDIHQMDQESCSHETGINHIISTAIEFSDIYL